MRSRTSHRLAVSWRRRRSSRPRAPDRQAMSISSGYRFVRHTGMALLVVAAGWYGGGAWAADPLEPFPVDSAQVSVSGISSGAFMANQLHMAHSAGIVGAGLIAGGLYGCTVDSVSEDGVFALASLAVGPCMSVPTLLQPVDFYAQLTADLAAKGWIDPPSNLARSRVYVLPDRLTRSSTPRRSNWARDSIGPLACPARM